MFLTTKFRAFTLIELLVVISIVSLLASVVLASLNTARERGRIGSARYFATQVDHIASDSALGMWDFDDCLGTVAADRSGNGNDGTLSGGASFNSLDTFSGQGCSISLNGTSGYVNVPDLSGAFSFPDGSSFTASLWLRQKSPDVLGSYERIISKESSSGGRQGWDVLWLNPGLIAFEMWRDNIAKNAQVAISADDMWHHLVFVFDGSKMYAYRDGVLKGGNSTTPSLLVNHTNPFRIGVSSTGGGYNPLSLVDAVRVYSKALTASEVGKLYASQKPKFDFASR